MMLRRRQELGRDRPERVDLDIAFAIRAARIIAWVAFDIRRWLMGGERPRHVRPALRELRSLDQTQHDVGELVADYAH
jgi:hypothetical protein